MRLIIVGASGFIGNYIMCYAKEKGYKFIGTQCSAHIPGLVKFDLLTDSIMEVIHPSFFETDEKIYCIISSAIPKIDKCWYERETSYKINVTNTIQLTRDLNQKGIKAVFLSSEAVYDGERGYYDETIAPCPVNEYGRQKAEVESYILNEGPSNLILRLSIILGNKCNENHLLAQWYKWIEENKPITCIRGQIFSPTYVEDVAKGTIEALKKNLYGLYNLANPEYFSRDELAHQFLFELNIAHEVIVKDLKEFCFPEKRSMKTYLDGNKFRKESGMNFTSMRELFRSFKDNIKK